jgi:divinyl chlorophyllide a 8-vinyl-reductase
MPLRIVLLGATGTIGRATAAALAARGHAVTACVRPGTPPQDWPAGVRALAVDLAEPAALARDGLGGGPHDVLVSCLASRTGAPREAWAIDHDATLAAVQAARAAGAGHVVLLSAICVQKPRLAFQHAKLACEQALAASGLAWTVVRPTAYFKSLSGQVARVQRGRPFLVLGDGQRTACKPLSDRDLAQFLADCVEDPARRGRVLPVGGPGPALTPLDQARLLAELLGRPVPVRRVPLGLLRGIAGGLGALARLLPLPALQARAEFARIGLYYATESMLVWDAAAGRYDADATPETGHDTLRAHYAALLSGQAQAGLGAHAVFERRG